VDEISEGETTMKRGKHEASTDWEADNGIAWPLIPLDRSYYAPHHYTKAGERLVDEFGPFGSLDRLARLQGFHCWLCRREQKR
jgi:hypothetical protein